MISLLSLFVCLSVCVCVCVFHTHIHIHTHNIYTYISRKKKTIHPKPHISIHSSSIYNHIIIKMCVINTHRNSQKRERDVTTQIERGNMWHESSQTQKATLDDSCIHITSMSKQQILGGEKQARSYPGQR